MEKLEQYLAAHGLSGNSFGVAASVSGATISRIRRGISFPDLQTAIKIEKATAGFVAASEWRHGDGTGMD